MSADFLSSTPPTTAQGGTWGWTLATSRLTGAGAAAGGGVRVTHPAAQGQLELEDDAGLCGGSRVTGRPSSNELGGAQSGYFAFLVDAPTVHSVIPSALTPAVVSPPLVTAFWLSFTQM
jgi:hypothetical protein